MSASRGSVLRATARLTTQLTCVQAFGTSNSTIFMNYFSVGVDGKIASEFEDCRQNCKSCFCCPCINKLWCARANRCLLDAGWQVRLPWRQVLRGMLRLL